MSVIDKIKTRLRKDKAGDIKVRKTGASSIEIGRYTYGYRAITVREWGEGANLRIGAFCSIAKGVEVMLGGNHRTDWATTFPFGHIFAEDLGGENIKGHPLSNGDVTIGNDVWIGRNATIMSGLTIGDGAVIAANSTVVKNVGAYEIWGGNPAKKIKDRFDNEISQKLLQMKWWDCDVEKIREIAPLLSQSPNLDILNKVEKILQNDLVN